MRVDHDDFPDRFSKRAWTKKSHLKPFATF
jgi:hypothetical protein